MHTHLINEDVLHADETTLQVLSKKGKTAKSKSYMWLYATGSSGPPIFMYEYQPSKGDNPRKFLEGFSRFLHTDGYAGYINIQNVTLIEYFAHARRGFSDALKALPK